MEEELAAIATVFRTCANVLRKRSGTPGLDGASNLLMVAARDADSAALMIDRALAKEAERMADADS